MTDYVALGKLQQLFISDTDVFNFRRVLARDSQGDPKTAAPALLGPVVA